MPRRALSSIVLGGLIAGAFDITYAIVFSFWRSGVAPSRVLQSVASGLPGTRRGGNWGILPAQTESQEAKRLR